MNNTEYPETLFVLYSVFKEKMGGDITKGRKIENIAARAAFAETVYGSKRFSYQSIGAVMGKNHATIMNAVRNAHDGVYKYIDDYNKAKVLANDILVDILSKRILDRTKKETVENIVSVLRDALNEERHKVIELSAWKEIMANRAERISKKVLLPIKEDLRKARNYMEPIGFDFYSTDAVEEIENIMRDFRKPIKRMHIEQKKKQMEYDTDNS